MSTLCDFRFLMSEVCALGEIFVKLLFFFTTPVHISPRCQKNYNLETSALICSHPSLELGLKSASQKETYLPSVDC